MQKIGERMRNEEKGRRNEGERERANTRGERLERVRTEERGQERPGERAEVESENRRDWARETRGEGESSMHGRSENRRKGAGETMGECFAEYRGVS